MRAVIQRVLQASVTVDGELVASISSGLLVLLGVENGDTLDDVRYMASKTTGLRIFADQAGLMNLSVQDLDLAVLAVSQFTLFGDVRHGKRPSFTSAASPESALSLYEEYCAALTAAGIKTGQGRFQADMRVALVNDGPVTILLDSRKLF